MKIHEYQAKAILARYGVPVPRGEVAFTVPGSAGDRQAARRHGRGGQGPDSRRRPRQGRRREGGQVGLDEAEGAARQILGMHAGDPSDRPGRAESLGRLLVEEGLAIERELYLEHRWSIARRSSRS